MSIYRAFIEQHALKLKVAASLGAFLVFAGLFGALADEVREGETLAIDREILLLINNWSTPLLDTIFSIGTALAGIAAIVAFTAALAGVFIIRRAYSKGLLLIVIVGGAGLANVVAKLAFARPRPELWERIVDEVTYSFPSGHAMGSMSLAFAIVLLSWNTKWRIVLLIAAALYVLFIGISRLYLGVHYPSDIAAGWILATAWGVIVMSLFHVRESLRAEATSQRQTKA